MNGVVVPDLERSCFAAGAGGMRVDGVGFAVDDVDVAAVREPAGADGCEMLIRVRNPAVVLFFKGVLCAAGGGIAAGWVRGGLPARTQATPCPL